MDITEFRQTYPMYDDLSDDDLADNLHSKLYSDLPREQFEGTFRPGVQLATTKVEEPVPLGSLPKPANEYEQAWQDKLKNATGQTGLLTAGPFLAVRTPKATDVIPPPDSIQGAVSRSIRKIPSTMREFGAGVGAVASQGPADMPEPLLISERDKQFRAEQGKPAVEFFGDIAKQSAAEKKAISSEAPYYGKRMWDNPEVMKDPSWWIENSIDAAVSTVPAIAGYMTGGKVVGGVVGGSMEGSGFYTELISGDKPVDPKTAAIAATTYGIASGILNSLGLSSIFGGADGIKKSVLKRIGRGFVGEGITEYAEEPIQSLIESVARGDNPQDAASRFGDSLKNIESGVFGGLLGGGVSAMNRPPVSKSAKDLGFTGEDFVAQKKADALEIRNQEPINDVAMQRFRDTYGSDLLARANQEVINRTWEQENAPEPPSSPPSESTPAPVPTGGPEYKAVAQSPAPLEPNIVESPGQGPVGRVLSPSLTDHPVQLALREVYSDQGQAEMEAERYGALAKVRFHVIDTPEGYKLRMGPEPKGELGLEYDQWLDSLPDEVANDPITFKALKEQIQENIRAEAGTGRDSLIETAPGEFKTQGSVDTDMVSAMRAELEARKAKQNLSENISQVQSENLDENFNKPKPLGADLKAKARDVTESLLSPSGGKGVAPEAKATGPEDLTGPIGKVAAMIYKKRLGDDKSLEIVPAGDGKFKVVKLYSFDPISMSKDTLDWLFPGEGLGKRIGNKYDQRIGLPYWTGMKDPRFQPYYDRASKRHETFTAQTAQALDKISSWTKMDETERANAVTVLLEQDGKKLKATPSPEIETYEENGKRLIRPVAAHIEEYRKFLDTKPKLSQKVKDFLVGWKEGTTEGISFYHNTLRKRGGVSEEYLQDLINNVGFVSNYFPHNWYGSYYIEGIDKDGNIKAKVNLPNFAGRMKVGEEAFIKGLTEDPTYKGLTWGKKQSASEHERFWMNSPVPIDIMARAIDESAKRLEDNEELKPLAEAYRKIIPQELAQIFKTRGYNNFAKRSGMLGYERQNVAKVYFDYMNGLYSGLAKMEAASDYTRMLFETKPTAAEHKLYTDFIADELAPHSKFDNAMDTLKGLFYVKYIGGRLKSVAVNYTTAVISAIPNLGIYVKGEASALGLHKTAWNDVRKQFMKEFSAYRKPTGIRGTLDSKDNVLSKDEVQAQKDLLSDGAIQAQQMNEYKGHFRDNAGWQYQIIHKLGLGMEMSEWYMRAATALASYRAFRDGKITHEPTIEKYGLTAGEKVDITNEARYAQAIEFAKQQVAMSYGDYTPFNKPQVIRGPGPMKALGRSMYTFRFFAQHLGEMWNWQLRHEPTGRGKTAFLKGMLGVAMLGGAAANPIIKILMGMYKLWEKEDPELALREKFPEHSTIMDLAFEGAPSLAGVYLGGSLEVGFPTSVKEAIGIPFAAAEDITNMYNAWESGNSQRAVEYMLPLVATKDLLAAYRGATQGQRTVAGRPISLPGEVEPTKFSPLETAVRAFGFRPLSVEKGWRLSQQLKELEDYKSIAQSKYADRYNNAAVAGDTDKQIGVLEEVIAWNMYWLGKDRVDMVIQKDSLNSALKSRALPERPSKQVLGRSLKAREAYGLK